MNSIDGWIYKVYPPKPQHKCNLPMYPNDIMHRYLLIGSVWQCNCGKQFEVINLGNWFTGAKYKEVHYPYSYNSLGEIIE